MYHDDYVHAQLLHFPLILLSNTGEKTRIRQIPDAREHIRNAYSQTQADSTDKTIETCHNTTRQAAGIISQSPSLSPFPPSLAPPLFAFSHWLDSSLALPLRSLCISLSLALTLSVAMEVNMTDPYAQDDLFLCHDEWRERMIYDFRMLLQCLLDPRYRSFMCVTRLIHLCDKTHSCV